MELDLKESAEGGMGPHGLVIGATGSGKSELLRTLVTGLAATHSSETLNLALIDFKGGATFAGMAELPHTCAVITNLSDELPLVDRMGDAINGEVVRRQELLRAAGNYASVRDYEKARDQGADLAPLPSLLVIIDEFSELLSSRPDFIDLFVMIGRLGRSLGIHLLLASQRLEEGRLRGLDSHLSYRVGLRTFSASESRSVLGVADAYQLPPVPGFGVPQVRHGVPGAAARRVRVRRPARARRRGRPAAGRRPEHRAAVPAGPGRASRRPTLPAPVIPRAAGRAAGHRRDDHGRDGVPADRQRPCGTPDLAAAAGRAAHRRTSCSPRWASTRERGLCPVGWGGNGRLIVPVAIVDKPFEQRRDLLWADLSGAAGHAIVVGAPQSGKSTLLRGLVSVLALTHTPAETQFFLLDMGGGALGPVTGLPHVSGYATRRDAQRCRRLVAEVVTLLAQREQFFAAHGIDSMAAFRQRRAEFTEAARTAASSATCSSSWTTGPRCARSTSSWRRPITNLAARGLGFGIHVVVSVNWWMGVRAQLRDAIGTRFELRLGDPADSLMDRRAAQNVPQDAPGRGLTKDKLHFLTALPRIDGDQRAATVAAGTTDLVAKVGGRVDRPGRATGPAAAPPDRTGRRWTR